MSRSYLTPLPRLLASALGIILNTMLRHDTRALPRLQHLQQRTLAVALRGINIDLFFTVSDDSFSVSLDSDGEPDTWIRGTPPALAGMGLAAGSTQQARPGAVQIQGDAELARAYQTFFSSLEPDWEEALAQRFGDVIGHRLASWVKQLRSTLDQSVRDGAAMTGDYLREESGLLVTAEEVDDFLEAVDEIRTDVDRLAARIQRLQQQA